MRWDPHFHSKRREAILAGLREGLVYKEIAARMNLSRRTVVWYMNEWFREEGLSGPRACYMLLVRMQERAAR